MSAADRWPAEVVEAAAEAIHVGWHDNYLDKHPWASLTDYQRGEFRLMARAALGVIPPDPVVAAIREDAVWLAKLASGSSWPGEMAHRVQTAADRVIAAYGSDADRAAARLLADGAGT